jgi:hypothetical protein
LLKFNNHFCYFSVMGHLWRQFGHWLK